MILCTLVAAALAACGGGSGGGSAGSTAAAAAGDGSTTTVADTGTTTPSDPATDAGSNDPSILAFKSQSLPVREGSSFSSSGTVNVEFGANGHFVVRSVSGKGECTNAFFGSDPAPGVRKACQAASSTSTPPPATTTTPTAAAPTSLMPTVDKTKIPAAAVGYSGPRIMAAIPGATPTPSDIGDFRETCQFSHMSYDDPIAAPGSVGAHLHTFLGNTGTNANSTATSLATTGNSTCEGGTLNRTAYWVPSLIDTTDGTPQVPSDSMIYYKQGYNNIPSASIKPFPVGLRILAGNPGSSSAQSSTGFTCYNPNGTVTSTQSIPTDCPAGSTLVIGVAFPQCWDGVNLDSPDHKSHMAYPGNGCPASHPVALTGITINVDYKVGPNGTSKWRLSSDNYDHSLPGGFSTHADWFGGWDRDILNTWTTLCINATMDCHAFLIGDGRTLY